MAQERRWHPVPPTRLSAGIIWWRDRCLCVKGGAESKRYYNSSIGVVCTQGVAE